MGGGTGTGVVTKVRSDRTFLFPGVLKRFALARDIELSRLTIQEFLASGRIDRDLRSDAVNCASQQSLKGFALYGAKMELSLLYFGYFRWVDDAHKGGVSYPSEQIAVESPERRARLNANPYRTDFTIVEKYLTRIIKDTADIGEVNIRPYEFTIERPGGLDHRDMRTVGRLLRKLF